nr:ulp1 protease family, C-terminal catalytic domain-containing protein [Tanacetum cinerariifolium]
MPGKRHILGVDNVVDEEEYDQFDELPPFSAGIPPIDGDTTYLRSDHDEGLWVDTPGAKRRRFKSKLTQHFIAKKNNNPKATYGVVNMTHWDEFVVSRESEEFKLKSAKAKASAVQNKNPSRLGRTALNELEDTFRHRKSKTCGKMVHTMC